MCPIVQTVLWRRANDQWDAADAAETEAGAAVARVAALQQVKV